MYSGRCFHDETLESKLELQFEALILNSGLYYPHFIANSAPITNYFAVFKSFESSFPSQHLVMFFRIKMAGPIDTLGP